MVNHPITRIGEMLPWAFAAKLPFQAGHDSSKVLYPAQTMLQIKSALEFRSSRLNPLGYFTGLGDRRCVISKETLADGNRQPG